MIPGSIALVPATAVAYMTGVIPFPYRPDADFLHLTGLAQPGAVAVVEAGRGDLTLFYTDPDVHRERWDGARMGAAAAADVFGAAAAFPLSEVRGRRGWDGEGRAPRTDTRLEPGGGPVPRLRACVRPCPTRCCSAGAPGPSRAHVHTGPPEPAQP